MVSQAGAMALRGLLPVVHSFACFLSTRPNEQIYNNATEGTKIIYVAPLAGLLPAGPGHSHQSVRDISAVGGTPNLVMIQPSCEQEVGAAVDYCVNGTDSSTYLRLVSIPVEIPFELPSDYALTLGRGSTLRGGSDGAVIAYGPVMLSEAYRAAEKLSADEGIELAVIDLPWLNRVDRDWIREVGLRFPLLFTIDDHYLAGGQGELILATLAELELESPPRTRRFGLSEIPLCGSNQEVLEAHGLDAASLARAMGETVGKRPKSALGESVGPNS
jgi:transketolase